MFIDDFHGNNIVCSSNNFLIATFEETLFFESFFQTQPLLNSYNAFLECSKSKDLLNVL